MKKLIKNFSAVVLTAVTLVLFGCGGGGGSSAPVDPLDQVRALFGPNALNLTGVVSFVPVYSGTSGNVNSVAMCALDTSKTDGRYHAMISADETAGSIVIEDQIVAGNIIAYEYGDDTVPAVKVGVCGGTYNFVITDYDADEAQVVDGFLVVEGEQLPLSTMKTSEIFGVGVDDVYGIPYTTATTTSTDEGALAVVEAFNAGELDLPSLLSLSSGKTLAPSALTWGFGYNHELGEFLPGFMVKETVGDVELSFVMMNNYDEDTGVITEMSLPVYLEGGTVATINFAIGEVDAVVGEGTVQLTNTGNLIIKHHSTVKIMEMLEGVLIPNFISSEYLAIQILDPDSQSWVTTQNADGVSILEKIFTEHNLLGDKNQQWSDIVNMFNSFYGEDEFVVRIYRTTTTLYTSDTIPFSDFQFDTGVESDNIWFKNTYVDHCSVGDGYYQGCRLVTQLTDMSGDPTRTPVQVQIFFSGNGY